MNERPKILNLLDKALNDMPKDDLHEMILNSPDSFFQEHTSFQNGREFLEKIPLEQLSEADKDQLIKEHTKYKNYDSFIPEIVGAAAANAVMFGVKQAVKVNKEVEAIKEQKKLPEIFVYFNTLLIIFFIKVICTSVSATAETEQLLLKTSIFGIIVFAINHWIAKYDSNYKKALLYIFVLISGTLIIFRSF